MMKKRYFDIRNNLVEAIEMCDNQGPFTGADHPTIAKKIREALSTLDEIIKEPDNV